MEKIIYDNSSLSYIINSICSGLIGLDDTTDIEDLVILVSNPIEHPMFSGIVIKPCVFDITEHLLNHLTKTFEPVDDVETEFIDFIVYTGAIDVDTGTKTMINKSFTEYQLIMIQQYPELLSMNIWKLQSIG